MGETTEHARRVVDLIREYDLEAVQKFPHAAHYVMGIAARKIERMTAQLEQVTKERDAAISDLRKPAERQGYWIPQDNTRTKFMCSDCKSRNHDGSGKYCSNCGAKMEV